MKYLAAIKSTLTVAAVILLNPIFIAGHVSAASAPSHEMSDGPHHSIGQSPSCISLCATATLKNEDETDIALKEQDDEPFPAKNLPYRTLKSDNFIPKKLASSYVQNQLVLRPPDLVILYSNFRF